MNAWKKYVESKERWRKKSTQYSRIYRHLDYFLQKAIDDSDSLLTIDEIREKLFEKTGFHFHLGTLKKYFKRCFDDFGDAPMEELYRLNPRYYEKRKVKPPRNFSI